MSFAKGVLMGNVVSKKTRFTKNGQMILSFDIMTKREFKDRFNTSHESLSRHNIQCYDKLATDYIDLIEEGDVIFVSGDIINTPTSGGERDGQYFYSIRASEIKKISGPSHEWGPHI